MRILLFYIFYVVYFVALCSVDSEAQNIVINEVMYVNKTSLPDEDGDFHDWIELYNPLDSAVDIGMYGLNDKYNNCNSWVFPNITMPAKSYLIVFASGKNRKHGIELHCDFKLKTMKEAVYLFNNTGIIIDSIHPVCVPPDNSLACYRDADISNRIVCTPTPGFSNNSAQEVEVHFLSDTLWLNAYGGFYKNAVLLEPEKMHANNTIHYTLNGSEPNFDDDCIDSSLCLHNRTPSKNKIAKQSEDGVKPGDDIIKAQVFRAQVYSNGCPASNMVTETYFIGDNWINSYNIPIVSLITDNDNLFDDETGIYVLGNHQNYYMRGKEWERDVHVEIFDSLGVNVIKQNAGMRIHGGGNRQAAQKSLRLYARAEYGKESFEYPLFTDKPHIQHYERLLLRSTKDWHATVIKDHLTQNLVKTMNCDYMASVNAIVLINGEYWGIYNLRERQDEYYVAANYHIDVPQITVIEHTVDGIVAEEGNYNEYSNLLLLIDNHQLDSSEYYEYVNEFIDLDALIDYYCAELYFANLDFPFRNLRMWKTECDTSRWRYFFYDCDACMQRVNYNHLIDYAENDFIQPRFHNDYTYILMRLLKNSEFRQKFTGRLLSHLSSTFAPNRVIALISDMERDLEPLMAEHIYRWHLPTDIVSWKKNIEMLKVFVLQRPVVLTGQVLDYFDSMFLVYPNPTTDHVYLNPNFSCTSLSYTITDIQGRVLIGKTDVLCHNPPLYLPLNLPSGMYILRLETQGMCVTKKICIVAP